MVQAANQSLRIEHHAQTSRRKNVFYILFESIIKWNSHTFSNRLISCIRCMSCSVYGLYAYAEGEQEIQFVCCLKCSGKLFAHIQCMVWKTTNHKYRISNITTVCKFGRNFFDVINFQHGNQISDFLTMGINWHCSLCIRRIFVC